VIPLLLLLLLPLIADDRPSLWLPRQNKRACTKPRQPAPADHAHSAVSLRRPERPTDRVACCANT